VASEQTDAIILRVFPWSETSLVVSLYTRDFGKLSALAKGARRPKGPFEAALDLLSVCRVVFIPKANDALDILTEAKLQRRFRAGARDLLRLYAGYYVAELLDRLTDKGDSQPEIFELASATLESLENSAVDLPAIVLRWELQMLRLTGHLPSWECCAQCGRLVEECEWLMFGMLAGGVVCEKCRVGTTHVLRITSGSRQILQQFSQSEWSQIELTAFSHGHRSALRRVITGYLTVLLDRKLQMHPYLEELGR
jgi:DNA repair protein RecO (recombination protein O)